MPRADKNNKSVVCAMGVEQGASPKTDAKLGARTFTETLTTCVLRLAIGHRIGKIRSLKEEKGFDLANSLRFPLLK
jgi:hypothetical protein